MIETLVVNLFAGAGAGKSTTAAGVFSLLKLHDVNCELVTEYAKQLAWQGILGTKRHDGYIFGKQAQRQHIPLGDVEVIITDSPLPLAIVYDTTGNKHFYNYVMSEFNKYNNLNFFIERRKKYQRKGRCEPENMAKEIDQKTRMMLKDNDIEFESLPGHNGAINYITYSVLLTLNLKQRFEINETLA